MNNVRYYGPALVLMITVIASMYLGPDLMRQMAFAEETGRIDAAEQQLKEADSSGLLGTLVTQFRSVGEKVRPSVVHITVKRTPQSQAPNSNERRMIEEFHRRFGMPLPRDFDRDPPNEGDGFEDSVPRTYGNGSGWVYDEDGHIVTNYHVVKDAEVIEVSMHDKSVLRAKLIGADPNTDIAVIKLARSHRVHPAELAAEPTQQGDIVFAFGSPFGETFSFSMSQGIVSGKGRVLGILDEYDRFGRRTKAGYENFIQTDAAINRGNSGGPLVDVRGRIVGMNTAIASEDGNYQGLGFAIPTEMIELYVPQLISAGKVRRGYLGVSITDEPKLLKSFGQDHGVLVDNLLPDGPAGEAGLEVGDIIVEVEQKKIFDADQLRQVIADLGPDTRTKVTVVRDGDRETFDVLLEELPSTTTVALDRDDLDRTDEVDADDMKPLRRLGFVKMTTLTERMAKRRNLEFQQGVMIESVRPSSAAASVGLRPGMLIIQVQDEPIEDIDDLLDEIEDADVQEGVRLRIATPIRDGWQESFVFLSLPE